MEWNGRVRREEAGGDGLVRGRWLSRNARRQCPPEARGAVGTQPCTDPKCFGYSVSPITPIGTRPRVVGRITSRNMANDKEAQMQHPPVRAPRDQGGRGVHEAPRHTLHTAGTRNGPKVP